jgi:hypothetical protein
MFCEAGSPVSPPSSGVPRAFVSWSSGKDSAFALHEARRLGLADIVGVLTTHGDSDLAMYKVLRDGVPGTAMVSPGLSFVERWQVIGSLQTLQPQVASAAAAFHLNVHVSSEEVQYPDR